MINSAVWEFVSLINLGVPENSAYNRHRPIVFYFNHWNFAAFQRLVALLIMAKLDSSLIDIADLTKPYETYESFVKTGVDILYKKLNQRILHHERLRGHKVDYFSIDQAYIFKSRKRFDPSNIRTWNKRDIITKWMLARKSKRDGVMELFCVITENMVPKSFRKTTNELLHDLKHGLEEAYCGQEIPLSRNAKATEPVEFEGIVLIVLFRFDFVATDLELFHNVQTLRDTMLTSYIDLVVERVRKTMEDYFLEKELPVDANDVSLMIGSTYADEGNRMVFDRMKFGTWVVRGLAERWEELNVSGQHGSNTLSAILAVTDDIIPTFLDGYELKYPYEFVTQDVALKIVEAAERFACEENGGKLCGLEVDIDHSNGFKMPWTLHHGAAVVYFSYRNRTQDVDTNSEHAIEKSDTNTAHVDSTDSSNGTQHEAVGPTDHEISTTEGFVILTGSSTLQEAVDPTNYDSSTPKEAVDPTNYENSTPQVAVDPTNYDSSTPQEAADPTNYDNSTLQAADPTNYENRTPQEAVDPTNNENSTPQEAADPINYDTPQETVDPTNYDSSTPQEAVDPTNYDNSTPQEDVDPTNYDKSTPQEAVDPTNNENSTPQEAADPINYETPQETVDPTNYDSSTPQEAVDPTNYDNSTPQEAVDQTNYDTNTLQVHVACDPTTGKTPQDDEDCNTPQNADAFNFEIYTSQEGVDESLETDI
jgi:hypothetical protein